MAPSYSNGRPGLNVSQFLRDLTTMNERNLDEADFSFEDDLAMFTNTQFFDIDSGQNTDYHGLPVKPDVDAQPSNGATTTEELTSPLDEMANFIPGDFNFGDFNSSYHSSGVAPFHEGLGNLQPLQPNPQPHYSASVSHQQHSHPQHQQTPQNSSRQLNFEDQSRIAAEEDKRRRNTAASARFRVKKKQREQALEKSAKEMTDKVTQLESRINLLETENRWLKNLVMEKNDGNEEIAAMLKEFDSKHKSSRTTAESTTSSESVKDEK